jgi:hypothetical protein
MNASSSQAPAHPAVLVQEGTSPVARATGPLGHRVITTRAVMPDQVLLVFEGTWVPQPDRYSVQVGEAQHLASLSPEDTWRYLNHGCAPSARIDFSGGVKAPRLLARKPLLEGEEVTFNYLTTEWDMATPFPCSCAAPSCVGRVQGARHLNDTQLSTLRHELAPHLQALLRSRLERL